MVILTCSAPLCCLHDRLQTDKFKIGNKFDSDENFISAVIKIQRGEEAFLTASEASAIEHLKKCAADDSTEDGLEEPGTEFDIMNRDRKKKKQKIVSGCGDSEYDPAIKHCVLGSAAEVERVWSMAGHVLTEHRASMCPMLFEIIMYLKYNARLWGLDDVIEANARRERKTDAAKKKAALQNERREKMMEEIKETWCGEMEVNWETEEDN